MIVTTKVIPPGLHVHFLIDGAIRGLFDPKGGHIVPFGELTEQEQDEVAKAVKDYRGDDELSGFGRPPKRQRDHQEDGISLPE